MNPPLAEKPLSEMSAQDINETLYDGADLKVTYLDGKTEVVKVRKIPRAELGQYSLHIGQVNGDETAECAYYVGRPPAWAETLNDESYDLVLAEGQRLNFTRWAAWFDRQSRKLKLVGQSSSAIQQAMEILAASPDLKRLLGSTNGSSPRDIETPISGATARRS